MTTKKLKTIKNKNIRVVINRHFSDIKRDDVVIVNDKISNKQAMH